MSSENIERDALLSADKVFRYRLSRKWSTQPIVAWLMLNPSTADALEDDQTVKKCIGFSQRLGFGALEVVNLFAFRATKPEDLLQQRDPVGPDYMTTLIAAIKQPALLIAAWGNEAILTNKKFQNRANAVLQTIRAVRPDLAVKCLGAGPGGFPYHPSRLAYDTPLVPYPVEVIPEIPEPAEQSATE